MTLRRTSLACSAVLFALRAPILSQAQPVDAGEVAERAIALHRREAEQLRRTIDRMSSIATEGITFGAETVALTVRRR